MSCVLVVDDDPLVGEVIAEAVSEGGMTVETADSDRAAYPWITALPTIGTLIIDIHLGVATTGFEVARFARQVIPDLGVLYVSGQVPPESFRSFGVPDRAFLMKPLAPAELATQLAKRVVP
ncbi:MAG: response regulator [Phenylobacterium sp.]|uniref:response regulator n=1 Tax=Phenylobacterium sp. TaxID=1871053 RepID=UPI003918D6CC